MNILIIGASKRFDILAESLTKKGYEVTYIQSSEFVPREIICDLLILPIPTVNKQGFLNLDEENRLPIDEIFGRITENPLIITCNLERRGYRTVDINTREDFAFLNAVPTAEGAIHTAVAKCGYSLFGSRILVTGFGRVAKILSDRLYGLRCDVTIAARSLKDLSYAKALGFKTVNISRLKEYSLDYDLIFQTIPTRILTAEVIDRINPMAHIIELSSASAGTDFEYAQKKGVNVIHAPALPARVAPITAGNILTESVMSIIAEKF